MKMVIGLTGGIASGKSTVVDFLISEGYQVIDADKVVRQLQEPDGKLYKAIVETYGLDFIADNGQLNREKLGALGDFSTIVCLQKMVFIKETIK